MKKYLSIILVVLSIDMVVSNAAYAGEEVNVYSYRQPILINPFFEEFTNSTGIKVNVMHAKKGVLERLLA